MGGILSSLNTPYTGITGHQVMVDTVSNNIANANNSFYSRQVVRSAAETPLWRQNYALGQGLDIVTVERVHNEYTYSRYKQASMDKTYYDTSFKALREASSFYPEIDGVGVYNDLQNYFNAWKSLATKSGDPALKNTLAEHTNTLTQNIQDTRNRLVDLQKKLNEEMAVAVKEVNRLGEQIATINKQIAEYERKDMNKKANDLRDLRDQYEYELNNLIGCDVFKQNIEGSAATDKGIADFDDDYTLTVGGRALVDGSTFHPLTLDNTQSPNGMYTIKYLRGDHKEFNLTNDLTGGKIGAILDLIRSDEMIGCNGNLGKLQNYINDLDTFANGFIEATNNIYAQSARPGAQSDQLTINAGDALINSGYNVKRGSFDVVIYNKDGEAMGTRTVKIDIDTTMNDVIAQLNANVDDNGDGDATNDFDDMFVATFNNHTKQFEISPKNPSMELYISIQDKGTNFAGALGVNRFLGGRDAQTIELAEPYKSDPTLIRSYKEPVGGNFDIANMMQQLQYDKITFNGHGGEEYSETISGFFNFIASRVASETEATQTTMQTKQAVYVAVQNEYKMESEVSIDDELVNLIRFQSGYGANAKMVTAIDEMITTLLGMKQ
ncbi:MULTISPECIES: flagellar hook-associated protein FlgK [Helicobacter]|uniref:Flagellar hook-associated protein 1 n=1 Tax=Helicobacter ibis TaxID=2962633 RepID=A0ABT4VC52_9HELI|nr:MULTISPECIES: flagellar hook-associated protein FlgK [Helicobacter]MDA3967537.1 flagellar hook-associated protein FlgK [Helicobacter sp. WB40]MDA3968285.1 flagellar hook-associated protein FlgK [Helicobacter ibis]